MEQRKVISISMDEWLRIKAEANNILITNQTVNHL